MTADVRVERPKRRGSVICRETWGCWGRGMGGNVVATASAVAWGRYWGGRGVLPLVCHGGAMRVRVTDDVRVERPERRGSAVCRETWGCRGRGMGSNVVATAGVVARGHYWGGRGVLPLMY